MLPCIVLTGHGSAERDVEYTGVRHGGVIYERPMVVECAVIVECAEIVADTAYRKHQRIVSQLARRNNLNALFVTVHGRGVYSAV